MKITLPWRELCRYPVVRFLTIIIAIIINIITIIAMMIIIIKIDNHHGHLGMNCVDTLSHHPVVRFLTKNSPAVVTKRNVDDICLRGKISGIVIIIINNHHRSERMRRTIIIMITRPVPPLRCVRRVSFRQVPRLTSEVSWEWVVGT